MSLWVFLGPHGYLHVVMGIYRFLSVLNASLWVLMFLVGFLLVLISSNGSLCVDSSSH